MDKRIFKILEDNAHSTPDEIATMTGLSVPEVKRQIRQAEEEKVILKYKALINWDKVGDDDVAAFIEVRVTPQKEVGFDSIAQKIGRFHQTRAVYLISGSFDLFVLVTGKSNRDISDFVSQNLSRIDGVHETVTQFVMKKYKEDGEVLDGQETVKRQRVTL
jgi:DNA-binding Lrp family transcriptional regulator